MKTVVKKSRAQTLSEALAHLDTALANLSKIDLRTTRGDLRKQIRQARELSDSARRATHQAIIEDANTLRTK